MDPQSKAILKAFASLMQEQMGPQFKASGTPEGPYLHGAGGTWGTSGLERDVISTHIGIVDSVGTHLPVRTTNKMSPYFPYITGFIRSDQQEKDGTCDNPEEAGPMKTCLTTAFLGRKEFRTRELDIGRVGELTDRGEMNDLQVVNTPLVQQLGGLFLQRFPLSKSQALDAANEMAIRMMEVGVAFQRWICPQVYSGNPANSSAGGGYEEFMGLDLIISTTKIDAKTRVACPTLRSTIWNYAYHNVESTNAPYNIVHVITQLIRKLNRKATQQNMAPVQFALAMRAQVFDVLTDLWMCEYATYQCQFTAQSGTSNASQSLGDMFSVTMRDKMKEGSYLLVDGRQIPVIQDDCIPEYTTADDANIPNGAYSSDIYVLPMSIRGGAYTTLYWETKDFNAGPMQTARTARAGDLFWTDGGRFLWSLNPLVNWCLTLIARLEPRLILRTPQLAARLQNVVVSFQEHWDDPLPSQAYWQDGGNLTGFPPTSPYSEYNL